VPGGHGSGDHRPLLGQYVPTGQGTLAVTEAADVTEELLKELLTLADPPPGQ
jgi:hypothetical protein